MNEPLMLERSEFLGPEPAAALSGLLDVPPPDAAHGLPLMWHWVYLLERPAQADLGPDGHPERGVLPVPPGPGYRRMWAGGAVRSHRPLLLGREATRRSQVLRSVEKQGRSGPLTFVSVGHNIHQDGELVVEERQDIVYRAQTGSSPAVPTTAVPIDEVPVEDHEWQIPVTPTLLFRFSALTYNGHRIHYDRDYARSVEGYPGLVTHGPLQALAMAEALRGNGHATVPGTGLEYRLVSPLYDHQGLVTQVRDEDGSTLVSVRDVGGRVTAQGEWLHD